MDECCHRRGVTANNFHPFGQRAREEVTGRQLNELNELRGYKVGRSDGMTPALTLPSPPRRGCGVAASGCLEDLVANPTSETFAAVETIL